MPLTFHTRFEPLCPVAIAVCFYPKTVSTQQFNSNMALHSALGRVPVAGLEQRGVCTRGIACPSVTQPRRQRLDVPHAVFNRNPTPPDAPMGKKDTRPVGREWLESILSRFGPATDRAQNVTTLDFEKPLLELDNRIKEVHLLSAVGVMSR